MNFIKNFVKMIETPEQKFKRVAQYRVNKILSSLKTLGNCSNKRHYIYTNENIDKIFSILQKQLNTTKAQFNTFEIENFNL